MVHIGSIPPSPKEKDRGSHNGFTNEVKNGHGQGFSTTVDKAAVIGGTNTDLVT